MIVKLTYSRKAHIVRFRDGDTCIIHVKCSCCKAVTEEVLRINHIDSHEPSGHTKPWAMGIAKVLTERFRGHVGYLIPEKSSRDKYGRLIGDILLGEELLSTLIVKQGLAWYGVGTTQPNTSQS